MLGECLGAVDEAGRVCKHGAQQKRAVSSKAQLRVREQGTERDEGGARPISSAGPGRTSSLRRWTELAAGYWPRRGPVFSRS